MQDDLVGPFLTAKENDDQLPSVKEGTKWYQLWNQLILKNGVLYHLFSGPECSSSTVQLLVPDSMKVEILYGIHEGIGAGVLIVVIVLLVTPHRQAPLQPVQVGYPMEMVAVDIMGPFL